MFLVEDAAHAVGADGVCAHADAAVFSFFGNKNMTTAEGGMIISPDSALLDTVRQMRSHGMTSTTWQRAQGQTLSYDVTMLGYNYRMDELRAAVGLVQLKRLRSWNEKRRDLTRTYRELLCSHCPDVSMPFDDNHSSSYHVLPVVLPATCSRDEMMQDMKDAGIQTTVHYPPAHLLSYYREICPGTHLPVTEEFTRRELTLPLYPGLEPTDVKKVVQTLENCLNKQRVSS